MHTSFYLTLLSSSFSTTVTSSSAPQESMENPLPTSRAEAFPAGLRVLIVDDDPTWLKILEKMLKKCSYEVTTCSLATEALDMLRGKRDRFDIVISDVNMPDMDGFKLLEQVGLEMDLPVIMMSIDGETSRVMKGVQHGACDYLLKPVRMKELRNIWQHVYRKRMHELKDIETHNIHEDTNILRNGSEDPDDRQYVAGTEMSSVRKRKDLESKEFVDHEFNDPSTVKKARVVWSVDLHQKFVNAVNQIGFDKVGPKKILDLMNVPGLTRENVASHLQKYRLYLIRLQRQNEGRACSGNLSSDFMNGENRGNNGFNSSTNIQSESELTTYTSTTENFQTQGIVPSVHISEPKKIEPVQIIGSKKVPSNDVLCASKVNNAPHLSVLLSFNDKMTNIKACEPATPKHKPLLSGTPMMQFMQYPKQESCNILSEYSCLTYVDQNLDPSFHQYSSTLPAFISATCTSEKDVKDLFEMKPVLTDYRNGHFTAIPVQVKRGAVNAQDIGAGCKVAGSPSIQDCYLNDKYSQGYFPLTYEFSLNGETEADSLPEDVHLCSLQKIGSIENLGFSSAEIYQYGDSTPTTDVESNWYDSSELNGEYSYDPVEYPLIDEYLFA
ncbi:hypothetical protein ZIOFF_012381 [Zingiber officinale]|uniref:Two-component response regulator n=3 Tax=Zingiber officinale TaxID=94328 RepID=A0A8J5HPA1_ZINOF|nr:hypothetical protein ZIOFF_012381 [Zingiber officinale]